LHNQEKRRKALLASNLSRDILIDVKYRASGKLQLKNFCNYGYRDVLFIIVPPNSIGVLNSNEIIEKAKDFSIDDMDGFERLEDFAYFDFSEEQKLKIRQYEKITWYLFSKLPDNRTVMDEVSMVKEDAVGYGGI
jgi:hypothetical protein